MRLIDADKLDWWYKGRPIRKVIDDAPTVDAVEVVRCKDCKYYHHDKRHGTTCRHPEMDYDVECYDHWISTKPDDFCSYGERKAE